ALNSGLLVPITNDTAFYVTSIKTLEIVDELMHEYRTNPRPALNWITMFVHYYFASASSYRLQQTFRNHSCRCLDYMTYIAPHVLNVLVTKLKVSTDDVQTARHIFQQIKRISGTLFNWMDNATRARALRRFDKIVMTLGVPRKFYLPAVMEKEYSFLPVFRGPFLENLLTAFKDKAYSALFQYSYGTRGQVLERDVHSFDLISPVANAYFFSYVHAVYLPTMVLSSPLLVQESLAATYGSIGSLFGHEMSHAFDPVMKSTDPGGVVVDWMSEASRREYQGRTDCLIRVYDAFRVPGRNYSLKTLAENFADIAGLQIALRALESDSCVRLDSESPVRGFTNKQLFYVAFCQQYCS
ncbi:unnamed protein product, partial [Ixodes hexagonus]